MDKPEQLESLWESHDFYLREAEKMEDEFSFLVDQSQNYFIQPLISAMRYMEEDPEFEKTLPDDVVKDVKELIKTYDEEEIPVEKETLLAQLKQISQDLESFYIKQLNSIKDLRHFYTENPFDIPPHREISLDLLDDLRHSTQLLLSGQRKNYKEISTLVEDDK